MSGGFERVAILGLGLLGGSVALAVRERGVARSVAGSARRSETRERALACGAVDEAFADPAEATAGADLVILATPVAVMEATLTQAAAGLAAGAIVTDVGSVKGPLADALPARIPEGVHYVGSHPMAGSHQSGLEHARADLLEGAPCVVTPLSGHPEEPARRVAAFWQALGARVVVRDPQVHDVEVAWVSHVPHAAAFAFARAHGEAPRSAEEVRGGGFRDFTRIARSEPELWADILLQNKKALAGPLEATARRLSELARLVEAGDAEGLLRFLAEARDTLSRTADEDARSGGANPEIQAAPTSAATQE
ncbi:MAG: prephenate dehydrogenase [Myxococcota bacterium]|nr:prephenate dehydrogenase [Myxococcota bacterium]